MSSDFRTFIDVAQRSARGEVALVNVPQAALSDLDPLNPGYGFVPVGRLPESIRASADGCIAVTGNVDSCDLAVLDVPGVANAPALLSYGRPRETSSNVVRRVELYAGGVRLEARPTAIELTSQIEQVSGSERCAGTAKPVSAA